MQVDSTSGRGGDAKGGLVVEFHLRSAGPQTETVQTRYAKPSQVVSMRSQEGHRPAGQVLFLVATIFGMVQTPTPSCPTSPHPAAPRPPPSLPLNGGNVSPARCSLASRLRLFLFLPISVRVPPAVPRSGPDGRGCATRFFLCRRVAWSLSFVRL